MDYIIKTPCGEVQGCAVWVAGTVACKGIRYATAGNQALCIGEQPTRMGKVNMFKLIRTMFTNKAVGE